ncbi:glycosyltransferase [Escherichia albertii]|uniref:Predicted glycosyltransferase n=1 Tax=Escherichia albertii TaxID=208962 RepID=A0A5A4U555_ESCAL|nr:glycosyltransferase [Escherichia albertii]MCU7277233.1 glycosyltransferase [Escherichia albertii]MCZ9085824.1 glycosyltransferase [Escherichia albertii]BAT39776.1 predicted glycosyltransferase [Escherichia albertii]BBM63205.1 predicted glycosyltransferase [Escherichia albertii]
MKKKVLYVVSTLKRSGPINQLYNLINNLSKYEFDLTIVTLSPEPQDSRLDDFINLGINVITLGLSRLKGIFFAKHKLKKIIDKINPDIVHSQGVRADYLNYLIVGDHKKISTIHNYPQKDFIKRYGPVVGTVLVNIQINAINNFDIVIGVSKAVAKNLIRTYKVKNAYAIINGIDTDIYKPKSSTDKSKLKEKLGLDKYDCIWISTGHLSVLKQPEILIKSFLKNKTDARFINSVFIFLGDGELSESLIMKYKHEKKIIFAGRVHNVVEYLQASDYFASASSTEGLPMAVIEALSCGLPVLLSRIGPHEEIIGLDERIGVLFDGDDASESFMTMVTKDKTALSHSCRSLALNFFSAEAMGANYKDIYNKSIKIK